MTPEHGGKIELRLEQVSEAAAEYRAELHTGAARFQGSARVPLPSGEIELGPWASAEEPPAWLRELARTALRAAFRTSQTEGRWPRRITRWRPEPHSS